MLEIHEYILVSIYLLCVAYCIDSKHNHTVSKHVASSVSLRRSGQSN